MDESIPPLNDDVNDDINIFRDACIKATDVDDKFHTAVFRRGNIGSGNTGLCRDNGEISRKITRNIEDVILLQGNVIHHEVLEIIMTANFANLFNYSSAIFDDDFDNNINT